MQAQTEDTKTQSAQPITHEDGSQAGIISERQSVGTDASWVKKGERSHFGYRG